MNKKILVIPAALTALLVTGCASQGSDSVGNAGTDSGPAEVTMFPKKYANVASKCDKHGFRIYVTKTGDSEKSSSSVAVVRDETCK